MGKKGCELCSNPARMFCDSDQASLCWDCDEKVHAANFLVAKHSRTLLCHVCHSPTPWTAAGPKLGPTVSVCHACAHPSSRPETEDGYDSQESESDDDDDGEYYSDSDDFSEEEEEDDDEEEEDGENQVVPWSTSASNSPPPPTAATSSSSEENVSFSSSKRTRNNPFESEVINLFCLFNFVQIFKWINPFSM